MNDQGDNPENGIWDFDQRGCCAKYHEQYPHAPLESLTQAVTKDEHPKKDGAWCNVVADERRI